MPDPAATATPDASAAAATPAPEATAPAPQPAATPASDSAPDTSATELFAMLDNVVDKRETQLARETLIRNGVDKDDVQALITAWRENKAAGADQTAARLSELEAENKRLVAEAYQAQVNTSLAAAMAEAGVGAERLAHIAKLADLSDIKDAKGTVDPAKVKVALDKVLEEIPELKGTTGGVSRVGSGGSSTDSKPDDELLAQMLKAAGVRSKP